MQPSWLPGAIFYHVYALGAFGAPARNSFDGRASNRLATFESWLDELAALGVNAVVIGPVFEASTHGYDVASYSRVDRRLGDEDSLVALSEGLHARGMRLVLDTVFHHTGRDFFAFRDVLEHGERSAYRDWYVLDFTQRSQHGDPFFIRAGTDTTISSSSTYAMTTFARISSQRSIGGSIRSLSTGSG